MCLGMWDSLSSPKLLKYDLAFDVAAVILQQLRANSPEPARLARTAFEKAVELGHAGARRALEVLKQEGH